MSRITKQSLIDRANRRRQRRLAALRKGVEHERPTQENVEASKDRWRDVKHEIPDD